MLSWAARNALQQRRLGIAGEVAIVEMAYGFDRDPAGFLPAFVSTHAVGHDGQAPLAAEFLVRIRLPVEKGILVILALQADVGQTGGFDPWLWTLTVDRHKRSWEWSTCAVNRPNAFTDIIRDAAAQSHESVRRPGSACGKTSEISPAQVTILPGYDATRTIRPTKSV